MDAKEIEEFLEACLAEDYLKIIQIAGIKILDENVNYFLDENFEKILETIMNRIEHGDYDYFFSKIYDEEYKSIVIKVLSCCTMVPDNINEIKGIIEDKKKREQLGIDSDDLKLLIKATNDPEYIKGIIEYDEIEGLWLYGCSSIMLIKATNDLEYIKGIIENEDHREELGFYDSYSLTILIQETMDTEYIKGIIENKKK